MSTGASACFVDSNVLLYMVDAENLEKQAAALRWRDALWENEAGCLSWQVLNEFYANATRKLHVPPAIARTLVESYAHWPVSGFTLSLLQQAWQWVDRGGISYWDALIVASAERLGCRWLLSEDFQDGRKYGAVQVISPFRRDPAELFGSM